MATGESIGSFFVDIQVRMKGQKGLDAMRSTLDESFGDKATKRNKRNINELQKSMNGLAGLKRGLAAGGGLLGLAVGGGIVTVMAKLAQESIQFSTNMQKFSLATGESSINLQKIQNALQRLPIAISSKQTQQMLENIGRQQAEMIRTGRVNPAAAMLGLSPQGATEEQFFRMVERIRELGWDNKLSSSLLRDAGLPLEILQLARDFTDAQLRAMVKTAPVYSEDQRAMRDLTHALNNLAQDIRESIAPIIRAIGYMLTIAAQGAQLFTGGQNRGMALTNIASSLLGPSNKSAPTANQTNNVTINSTAPAEDLHREFSRETTILLQKQIDALSPMGTTNLGN